MGNRALAALVLTLVAALWLVPRGEPAAPATLLVTPYPPIAPRGYVCYRAPGPITLDGKLDDPAWAAAPWSDDFVDIEGPSRPAPRFRTRMKMLWDDHYLYIAAWLDEPHVWGTLRTHDSVIFHDNDFEVFLDPDGDSHLYAELELNALNTTWDLLLSRPYKDGGRAIDAWEVKGLKTAVHVDGTLNRPGDTDRGWGVEIAWPFKSLAELSYTRSPPRDGDQWRVNFSRVQWRHEAAGGSYRKVKGTREDNWVWSPQGVIDMHRPERWGVVQFSSAPAGTARYRPDPAATTRHRLHRVYYAQRDFRKARGRWATSLAELGLAPGEAAGVRVETTSSRYEASAADPTGARWRIGPDGRIAKD